MLELEESFFSIRVHVNRKSTIRRARWPDQHFPHCAVQVANCSRVMAAAAAGDGCQIETAIHRHKCCRRRAEASDSEARS